MVNEATAKARRSEALFRSSNAGISRRWLTDKVADLEWECARLRVQLDDAAASNGRLEERCSKLRELVDYMTPIALYGASEHERDRMRELGAEVEP